MRPASAVNPNGLNRIVVATFPGRCTNCTGWFFCCLYQGARRLLERAATCHQFEKLKMPDLLALKNRAFGEKYRAPEKIGIREKILRSRLVVGVQSFDFC